MCVVWVVRVEGETTAERCKSHDEKAKGGEGRGDRNVLACSC